MKLWFYSILFPVFLIILLAILTIWINKIMLVPTTFSIVKTQPIATMYDANIRIFDVNGKLEHEIQTNKITQTNHSNSFLLMNSKISHYKNDKIIQYVTAKQALYNAETKDIQLTGRQKNNRLEIIINEL